MEDIIIVESKDYAQVLFDDVKECYQEEHDLECNFTLNELLKADQSDFIGIYKVGFINTKDYCCYEMIENVDGNKGRVRIAANKLPKDDGEFYQFIYVSRGKHVRGASIPFQFKKLYISDYVQVVEEESDAILIKSKEAELNEALIDAKMKCASLSDVNDTYGKLLKENEALILKLTDELTHQKARCLNLAIENERINATMQAKNESLKGINDAINELTSENSKLKDRFELILNENKNREKLVERKVSEIELLKADLKSVQESKEELEAIIRSKELEIGQLRRDKDELTAFINELQKTNDQVNKLEKQVGERVDELNKIKNDLKQNELLIENQSSTIQAILCEKDALNKIIQTLVKERDDIIASRDCLNQELVMTKDKVLAVEQSKELLRTQLVTVNKNLDEINAKSQLDAEKIAKLAENEEVLVKENEKLVDEINRIKIDYSTKLEECNGSYFALNLAHNHVESQMKALQQKHVKETDSYKTEIEKFKLENENLKQRIRAGAQEYAKLNTKYLKLKTFLLHSKNKSYDAFLIQENENNNNNNNLATSVASSTMIEDKIDDQFKTLTKLDDCCDNNKRIIEQPAAVNVFECKSCDICGHLFPTDLDFLTYEQHIESHYGPSCPLCFETFQKGIPQAAFEEHVNSHFNNNNNN